MTSSRDEEVDVLVSIYGDTIDVTADKDSATLKISFNGICNLSLKVVAGYPETDIPILCLDFPQSCIDVAKQAQIYKELQELIETCRGSAVLYQVIELAREKLYSITDTNLNSTPAFKCQSTSSEVENDEDEWTADRFEKDFGLHDHVKKKISEHTVVAPPLRIIHGEVVFERKSSFQSHFCVVSCMDDVHAFRSELLLDKKIARATHNIFAFRFSCPKTGVVYHDNDDDGETAAGGRLAEMIRLMGVDGVAIIVSRWFGGVLLGPDRFKFICNSARHLLEEHGYGISTSSQKKSR